MIDQPTVSWLGSFLPAAARKHRYWPRIEHWLLKLGEFFLAQGLLQAVMFLGSFYLLRWMSVGEYAIFTLVFALQSSMIAFCDVGFTGAIVPLVGERVNDRAVVGAYVAGARRLRLQLLPIVLVGGLAVFGILGARQHLPVSTILCLYALVATTVWFNAIAVLYTGPIVIRQELRFVQGAQNVQAVLRFAAYALGHATGWLGSIFAIATNTLLNAGVAGALRRRGRPLIDEPPGGSPAAAAARREILRFVLPQVPLMLYSAVQGQLTVYVISLTGTATALAEVGALSRLNQILSFMPFLLSWIIQPYFARLNSSLVRNRLAQVGLLFVAGLLLLTLVGFFFPAPFLWILGRNYNYLQAEVGMVFCAGMFLTSSSFVGTVMIARRWIYRDAIFWIAVPTLLMQGIAAFAFDVSTVKGTLWLMILGSLGNLLGYMALAGRGIRQDRTAGPGTLIG